MNQSQQDIRWMTAAIRLSRRHQGLTKDNPSVAALVVRDNIVWGAAVTAKGGRPHAEPQALEQAKEKAHGSTIYVTLEPCSHYGQTPPCVDALIAAKVARVVVGMIDPDPRVAGRGIEKLRQAGCQVNLSPLQKQVEEVLGPYLSIRRRRRPEITLKMVQAQHGIIGQNNGQQLLLSGDIANAQTHMLRARSDAILIGVGTACNDDPFLTCRLPGLEDQSPIRIVLDPHLRLPLTSRLVQTCDQFPLWIIGCSKVSLDRQKSFTDKGIKLLLQDCAAYRINLKNLVEQLAEMQISSLLVEGGKQVAQSFFAEGLVDNLIEIHSPKDFTDLDDLVYAPQNRVPSSWMLEQEFRYGDDLWLKWAPQR